jgi:hypothetical protein
MFDAILTKVPDIPTEDDIKGFFIDIPTALLPDFENHLQRYKMRNNFEFENIS